VRKLDAMPFRRERPVQKALLQSVTIEAAHFALVSGIPYV